MKKKYGLEDKGREVENSQRTKEIIKIPCCQPKRVIKAGRDWAKIYRGTYKKAFGKR